MKTKKKPRSAEELAKALKKSRRNSAEYQKLCAELRSELDVLSFELEECECTSDEHYRNLDAKFDKYVQIHEREQHYQYLAEMTRKQRIMRVVHRVYWKIRRILGYKPKLVAKKKIIAKA